MTKPQIFLEGLKKVLRFFSSLHSIVSQVSVSLHEISLWLVLASLAACLAPHLYLFPDLCYPMTKKTGVKNGESVRYGEESQES